MRLSGTGSIYTVRNSVLAAVVLTIAAAGVASADERSVPALIRDLRSENDRVRFDALVELQQRGPAAAPAVPAIIQLLTRVGWDSWRRESGESHAAFTVLRGVGPPAKAALPLLVHFMVDSESGDLH